MLLSDMLVAVAQQVTICFNTYTHHTHRHHKGRSGSCYQLSWIIEHIIQFDIDLFIQSSAEYFPLNTFPWITVLYHSVFDYKFGICSEGLLLYLAVVWKCFLSNFVPSPEGVHVHLSNSFRIFPWEEFAVISPLPFPTTLPVRMLVLVLTTLRVFAGTFHSRLINKCAGLTSLGHSIAWMGWCTILSE